MIHLFRRLLPVAGLIAVLSTAVALAAPKPAATTEGPSNVTSTSATLNGVVQTGPGPTTYQFQYGTSTSYDKATPVQTLSAKNKAVAVSAAIGSLSPGVTYHYRLVVTPSKGAATNGNDVAFTTLPIGNLLLGRTKLRVHHGFVRVPLGCFSQLPCKGRFSITTRARIAKTGKVGTLGCASTFYRIPADSTRIVRAKVKVACLSLLKTARRHRIKAKFTSHPRTGQVGVIISVRLFLH